MVVEVIGIKASRRQAIIFLADLAVMAVVIPLSVFLRLGPDSYFEYLTDHITHFFLLAMIFIITFHIADLYNIKRDFRRAYQQLYIFSVSAIAMVVSVFIFYSRLTYVGRGIFLAIALLIPLCTGLVRSLHTTMSSSGLWKRRVLIVGAGCAGQSMLDTICKNGACDLTVIGFVDDDPEKQGTLISGKPVMGGSRDLIDLALKHRVDMIVLGITHKKNELLVKNLIKCYYMHITVLDMPTVYENITGKLPLKHITEEWLLNSAMSTHRLMYKNFKRFSDISLSLVLLAVASPLMALAAILIVLDSKGGVLFRQKRVGMNFKEFLIYKFRTMYKDADRDTGPTSASKNDARVTRVGMALRKLHIDELPQLFNVLKGDMSFVGPRPDITVLVNELAREVPIYGYRLVVRPGITGWAQVMYRYAETKDQFVEKLRYDLYYIKNMSIILDILIVLRTIKTVFTFSSSN